MGTLGNAARREPGNQGKLVGQKAPFKLKDRIAAARRSCKSANEGLAVIAELAGRQTVCAPTNDWFHGGQTTVVGRVRPTVPGGSSPFEGRHVGRFVRVTGQK